MAQSTITVQSSIARFLDGFSSCSLSMQVPPPSALIMTSCVQHGSIMSRTRQYYRQLDPPSICGTSH